MARGIAALGSSYIGEVSTPLHPGSRGPLRKLGQKLKRGSQIEPYRLSHSFNGLLFTILIHFRSNKARRKQFGGPFLVLVSNFLKILVWNPIALASGCTVRSSGIILCKILPLVRKEVLIHKHLKLIILYRICFNKIIFKLSSKSH